jgi:thiosulfate/3-mercaptopyruvate sulfurtransferase
MQNQSPIIEVDELIKISENPNLRILMSELVLLPKKNILKKHLKNSVFVDLNSDLAEIDNPKMEVDIRFRNLKILSRL